MGSLAFDPGLSPANAALASQALEASPSPGAEVAHGMAAQPQPQLSPEVNPRAAASDGPCRQGEPAAGTGHVTAIGPDRAADHLQDHALRGAVTLRAIARQMGRVAPRSAVMPASSSAARSKASSSDERHKEGEAAPAPGALVPEHMHYRYLQLQYHDPVWEYEWIERWME